jgi:DNA-binding IclR family transcriptional regulator
MLSGVHHARRILNLFTAAASEWGAADAARSLGISRSHAHRLLSTLAEVGLLTRVEQSGRFRLSWTWFEYADVIRASDPLISSGAPIMLKLRHEYGLESLLAVWRDGEVVSFSPESASTAAHREFSDCPALRLVLMAGLPDDQLAEHLASTGADPGLAAQEDVHRAVRRVRAGELLVTEQSDAGGRWLAAPVMDREHIVAALRVYARRTHCPNGQRAIDVVRKASTWLSSCVRRATEGPKAPAAEGPAVMPPAPGKRGCSRS